MDKIKCLLVKPNELPNVIETSQELEDLQSLVDGYIECISLDNETLLICNEEGKIRGLPLNRRIPRDVIAGTFIVVGDDYDNACFKSLTEEQIEKYMKQFGKESIIYSPKDSDKIKFLVSAIKSGEEKHKLEEMGLYCYDLRESDEGRDIASIEKTVVVNRIGTMITDKEIKLGDKYPNDFVDYNTFVETNIQVDTIKELLDKGKNKEERSR